MTEQQPQPHSVTSTRVTRRRSGQRITKAELPKLKDAFLKHFARYANVAGACRKVGVSRNTIYQWQEHDEVFALQFKQAELDACDVLRREAYKRAVVGWDEPLVSAGRLVAHVHKKSDAVLLAMLKARVPEYREKLDLNATMRGNVSHDLNLAQDAESAALAGAFFRRLTELRASESTGPSVSGE